MKIVFDNIVFSLQKRGGISVVWKEVVSRFLRNGKDDLTFVEYEANKSNMFHEEMDLSQGNVVMRGQGLFSVERYRDLRMHISAPFIFHSSYFRLCKDRNAVNVATVHDFTYEFAYRKRRGSFLHFWQRNRAIRKADAVICISESTKRDLMKYLPDVPKEKLYVIYNAASREYRLIGDKIPDLSDKILYVGARGQYKNSRWFAECIKDTAYQVIFCGSAMCSEEKEFFDRVLGADRYEVKVGLSNEELNRYYNSVKCLVYPSSYEGFGIPIIEAQSAGCPVIAYNTSSIPEVIGKTPLLMERLTKEELLSKLRCLDDKDMRDKIIADGLENAKRFSWDRAYEEYRRLYEKLLKERHDYAENCVY